MNMRKHAQKRTCSMQHTQKRARQGHTPQKAGNLAGHTTGTANKPEEDKEEDNTAGNCKQPAMNPVGGGHGWGNENKPTSAPRTLGIPGARPEG